MDFMDSFKNTFSIDSFVLKVEDSMSKRTGKFR